MCSGVARVGMLAFNPIITSTTPSYSIPHFPLINTLLVLTAAVSVIVLKGGYNRNNDPARMYFSLLASKIRSLLEVWLRLLMSTSPVSWTLWQIIFTANILLFSISFFFSLSLSSVLLSDYAVFCLKEFFSGFLPELLLRSVQHFSTSHTIPTSFFFSFAYGILLVFISQAGQRPGGTLCYWISVINLSIWFEIFSEATKSVSCVWEQLL